MEKLVRNRGTCKGKITRVESFLKQEAETAQHSKIRIKMELLDAAFGDYQKIQQAIEDLVDDAEIEEERENGYQMEEVFVDLKSRLMALIEPPHTSSSNRGFEAGSEKENIGVKASRGVKPPKIQLPTFTGKFEDWSPFSDLFSATIDQSPNLTDVEKFYYLRGSLAQEPLNLVQSLPLTNENYAEAWKILKDRYANSRLIIRAHLTKLFNIPKAQSETVSSIKSIIDVVNVNLRALRQLKLESNKLSDAMLMHLISLKLDAKTCELYETAVAKETEPSLETMLAFLEQRMNALSAVPQFKEIPRGKRPETVKAHQATTEAREPPSNCALCSEAHLLFKCPAFNKMEIRERIETVKKLRICFNCLRPGHRSDICEVRKCKTCDKPHHTMLHLRSREPVSSIATATTAIPEPLPPVKSCVSNSASVQSSQVILATILIRVYGKDKQPILLRAVLDPGSQANFITESSVHRLRLAPHDNHIRICGIANSSAASDQAVSCRISSRLSKFSCDIEAIVVPKITEKLPSAKIDSRLVAVSNHTLADPCFDQPGSIDLLLGAEIFLDIFVDGHIKSTTTTPSLRKTVFGWVIAGRVSNRLLNREPVISNHCRLVTAVEKFWNLEECPTASKLSTEENECEELFTQNTYRLPDGRFCVRLPTKRDPSVLGESRDTAIRILKHTQKRLSPEQKTVYFDFMSTYIELGHMSPIKQVDLSVPHFYLPHHAVFKASSTTTKLRVVFNGTKPTTNGTSLNDILLTGPVIQNDLFSTLIRFRGHRIAICADIAMMYRQVLVRPIDRDLQRIVWFDENGSIKDFQLNTVTYGLACSSYLAIRSLAQLAQDEGEHYPLAAPVLTNDSYVDDIITGASDPVQAAELVKQLHELTQKGQFTLRKWSTNQPEVLESITDVNKEVELFFNSADSVATLGLNWIISDDIFQIRGNMSSKTDRITKRTVLAEASRLFDPLGFVSPIIIVVKVFMQTLWKHGLDWDVELNEDLRTTWLKYRDMLLSTCVKIPRSILSQTDSRIAHVQLHGFCDASETAYAACLYVRCQDESGKSSVHLLCSKTRVAPANTISIPRLELCGAVLLSRLLGKVLTVINVYINEVFLWTDSAISLAWIRGDPSRWKTFVANRVAEIRKNTSFPSWKHVSSADNPADLASRGVTSDLSKCSLWWHGPEFLKREPSKWPQKFPLNEQGAEKEAKRKKVAACHTHLTDFDIMNRYSSFSKLIRVTAFCLRFKNALKPPPERDFQELNALELKTATHTLIKIIQGQSFPTDLFKLQNGKPLSKKSSLLSLCPFLDDEGLIRVGGRLANAEISYDQRYPILLPHDHFFSLLLTRDRHVSLLHASSQLLLSSIRQEYWIIRGRSLSKRVVRECVTCRKFNARLGTQLMGQLPKDRINASFAFEKVGIDFAGPFSVKTGGVRSRATSKAYLCVFVCMSTKAVHLDLTTALTTKAFIQVLQRFVARRGKPSTIYSDNGKNFVGAYRELSQLCESVEVQNQVAQEGIRWSFIPPRSPHFGGLWEASIKGVKSHLKRVVGETSFTFEELITLLTRVEACLNSRPLYPLSDDPRDFGALTPGHFLIGRPLTAYPEADLTTTSCNPVQRFEQIEKVVQVFWKKWSLEYLNHVRCRSKWRTGQRNYREGDLVLLQPDAIPTSWKIGRIARTFPGADGLVRVADIQTSQGLYRRPITKIACLLPASEQDHQYK